MGFLVATELDFSESLRDHYRNFPSPAIFFGKRYLSRNKKTCDN